MDELLKITNALEPETLIQVVMDGPNMTKNFYETIHLDRNDKLFHMLFDTGRNVQSAIDQWKC